MRAEVTKNRKRAHLSAAAARKKKITVDIPSTLTERAEVVSKEQHTTFSEVVREALENHVRQFERARLEEDLRLGCLANADLDRAVCGEFEVVDAEVTA